MHDDAPSASTKSVIDPHEAAPARVAVPSGLPDTVHCLRGQDSRGAHYLIAVPDEWNGNLAVHAHGVAGAYLASATGTKVAFIHYKGNAQGFVDLIAGRTQVSPMTTFAAQPYLKSGKVRPIAHLSAGRSRSLPDLPSVAELGVTGFDYPGWGAILAVSRAFRLSHVAGNSGASAAKFPAAVIA